MTGAFHLRMMAGLMMASGVASIAFEAMQFYDGIILLAVWLLRGSNLASYLISAASIVYIGAGLVAVPEILKGGALMAAWIAFWLLLAPGYFWWAATFSRKVRAELARRREGNKIRDRETRRKFFQQTREATETKDAA
jgi:hypothetical protein